MLFFKILNLKLSIKEVFKGFPICELLNEVDICIEEELRMVIDMFWF